MARCNTLRVVHQRTQFSWPFSLHDVAAKWQQMLFRPDTTVMGLVVRRRVSLPVGAAAVGPGPPLCGRTLLTHVPGWVMPLCWQRPGGTRRRTKAQPHVVTLEQVRAQRLESLERHNPSLNYSHVYVWHCFRLVLVQ